MKLLGLLKDIRVYRALARKGLGEQTLQALALEDPTHIFHAQRLHAAVYLHRGFVEPAAIGDDGRLTMYADPHQAHAEYFVILGEKDHTNVRAVSRQIRIDPKKGFGSFPILELANIDKRRMRTINGYDPATVVEISALAKRRGESALLPLVLYRAMLHRSIKNGDKLWLMACDVRLFQRLKLLFGPAIVQIGQVSPYHGGDVVPALLKLDDVLAGLLTASRDKVPLRRSIRKSLPRFFLRGFPEEHVSAAQRAELTKLKIISKLTTKD